MNRQSNETFGWTYDSYKNDKLENILNMVV